MTRNASIFLAALLLGAAPALAEDRDFCADRPGLGTPACTVSPGQVMAEVGAVDWDHSTDPQSVTDTVTYGETLVRIGLTESSEIQIGRGGYGTERTRDRASGRGLQGIKPRATSTSPIGTDWAKRTGQSRSRAS